LVNGEPQTVVVRPDAPKDATAIDVVGDGFTMKLAGLGANGQPLGVTSDGALILQADRTAAVEGTGFLPNSDVNLYTFSTPRFLGTVKTDAAGNFKGTVPLPTDIPPGRHTLQSNGLAPDGAVRSLSLGVLLSADKVAGKPRTVKATVYFDALSPALTSSAKASLRALVKGRAAKATRTLVVGYVQDSGLASNNQTLSSQRAKTIAAYLRSLGLKGAVVTRGDGVATESGAAGRKAVVTIRYLRSSG
jgi:outer membrane protein OmpA-like peptidoglycan-associated protein